MKLFIYFSKQDENDKKFQIHVQSRFLNTFQKRKEWKKIQIATKKDEAYIQGNLALFARSSSNLLPRSLVDCPP